MKRLVNKMEEYITWRQRGAGQIMGDTKIYQVPGIYVRDKKTGLQIKNRTCSGLKGRGSPFFPTPHFFISRHNHASL